MKRVALEKEFLTQLDDQKLNELFKKYHAGSKDAFDKIINHNIILIFSVIKNNFKDNKISFDELFQTGSYALIKAAQTFDETKGVKFATYACTVIRNEILMLARKENKHRVVSSYNIKTGKKNNVEMLDLMESDERVEESILEKELVSLIRSFTKLEKNDVSDVLTNTEKIVINYLYGINGYPQKIQNEIGVILHCSQSYVSKVAQRAILKIRSVMDRYGYYINNSVTTRTIEKSKQSFYNLFPNNTKEEIDNIIKTKLTRKEIEVLLTRFGFDLENPKKPEVWNSEYHKVYFSVVLPKIQKHLLVYEQDSNISIISSCIYDILKPYSIELINEEIASLSYDEQKLLKRFYGDDLTLSCILDASVTSEEKEKLRLLTKKMLASLKNRKLNFERMKQLETMFEPQKTDNSNLCFIEPECVKNPVDEKIDLNTIIQGMPFTEAMILSLNFGFSASRKYTAHEIAKVLKLNEDYVGLVIRDFNEKHQIDLENNNVKSLK